jgi:hypothetical protein
MVLVGLAMRPFHSMHASDIHHNHRDSSLQHRSIGRPTWQEARRKYKLVCSGNDPSVASICVPQVLLCTSFASSGNAINRLVALGISLVRGQRKEARTSTG